MIVLSRRNLYLLLLAACCVTFVECFNKSRGEKFEEIDEMFNEIEKNHMKLKKVFEDILTEGEEKQNGTTEEPRIEEPGFLRRGKEEQKCQCLPYHLCDPEVGEQISDGRFLLQSRTDSFQCADRNEVCCIPYSHSSPRIANPRVESPRTMSFSPPKSSKCGYGYSSDIAQQLPVDDPTLSNFGQFPWTVMINKAKRYSCGGSLIHPRVVLTSAHCVNVTGDLNVRAGEWNTSTKTEPFGHQTRNVKDVIKHPDFRLDNLFYDVALLILEEEFQLQENINTVCLTKSAPDPLVTQPDRCVVTGWGIDKPNGRYNRVMKRLDFSLVDYERCQQTFRSTRLGSKFVLHQTFLCACGHNGSDACDGYGGAPLVCPLPNQPNRYQQVGTVSWGIACAEGPSVFTKVSQVRDWIDEVLDSLKLSKEYCTE